MLPNLIRNICGLCTCNQIQAIRWPGICWRTPRDLGQENDIGNCMPSIWILQGLGEGAFRDSVTLCYAKNGQLGSDHLSRPSVYDHARTNSELCLTWIWGKGGRMTYCAGWFFRYRMIQTKLKMEYRAADSASIVDIVRYGLWLSGKTLCKRCRMCIRRPTISNVSTIVNAIELPEEASAKWKDEWKNGSPGRRMLASRIQDKTIVVRHGNVELVELRRTFRMLTLYSLVEIA